MNIFPLVRFQQIKVGYFWRKSIISFSFFHWLLKSVILLPWVFHLVFFSMIKSLAIFFFSSADNINKKLVSHYKYMNLAAAMLYVSECLLLLFVREAWKNSGITGKNVWAAFKLLSSEAHNKTYQQWMKLILINLWLTASAISIQIVLCPSGEKQQ